MQRESLLNQVKSLVETERMMMRDEIRRREREIEHLRLQLSRQNKKESTTTSLIPKKRDNTLNLSSRVVFPGELDSICETVCHKILRVVNLSRCSLDARCASPVATLCSFPFRVTSLDLSGNEFGVCGLKALNTELRSGRRRKISSLLWLDLSSNPFGKSKDSIQTFQMLISNFPKLLGYGATFTCGTNLKKNKQKFRSKVFRDLLSSEKKLSHSEYASSRRPVMMSAKMSSIRSLRLSNASLPCSVIRHAFYTKDLMCLDLAYAFIGHDGAVALARLIRTCRSLITLSVRRNGLRDEAATLIVDAALDTQRGGARLIGLDLSGNLLSTSCLEDIGKALHSDSTLISLRLGNQMCLVNREEHSRCCCWDAVAKGIARTGTVLYTDTNHWSSSSRIKEEQEDVGAIWAEIYMNRNRRRAWIWSSSILPNILSSPSDDNVEEDLETRKNDKNDFQLGRRIVIPSSLFLKKEENEDGKNEQLNKTIRLEFEANRVSSHALLRRRLRREDKLVLDWKLFYRSSSSMDGERYVMLAHGHGEDAMIEHDSNSNRRRYVVATCVNGGGSLEIWIRSKGKIRIGYAAIWIDREMKSLKLSGSSERLEITKWNTARESAMWKCHPRCVWIPSSCSRFNLCWIFHCTNLDMNDDNDKPWLKWKLTTASTTKSNDVAVIAVGLCGSNSDRELHVEGLHRVVVTLNTQEKCRPGDMLHLWFRPCDRVMSKASLCGETHVGVITSAFYLMLRDDDDDDDDDDSSSSTRCPIWSSDAAVDFSDIDPFTSGWNRGVVEVGKCE